MKNNPQDLQFPNYSNIEKNNFLLSNQIMNTAINQNLNTKSIPSQFTGQASNSNQNFESNSLNIKYERGIQNNIKEDNNIKYKILI